MASFHLVACAYIGISRSTCTLLTAERSFVTVLVSVTSLESVSLDPPCPPRKPLAPKDSFAGFLLKTQKLRRSILVDEVQGKAVREINLECKHKVKNEPAICLSGNDQGRKTPLRTQGKQTAPCWEEITVKTKRFGEVAVSAVMRKRLPRICGGQLWETR